MPYDRLVKLVAAELYEEELRSGAWLVDIGLFGSDLFVPDVAHEVSAKNGTHWQFDE
jgi:hypothetical protein